MWVTMGAKRARLPASRSRAGFGIVVGAAHVENRQFFAAQWREFHRNLSLDWNAGDDHPAGVARGMQAMVHRSAFRRAVDGHVHAAAARIAQDFARRIGVRGIQNSVRAHLPRELAARTNRLDCPDPLRAGQFQTDDSEQPDRTRAEDRGSLPRAERHEFHGVQNHGERLDEGGLVRRHVRRDGDQVARGKIGGFAKKTGIPGHAHKTNVGTNVVVAGAAEFAMVAVDGGLERRAVARRPAGDAWSRLMNHAGRLVPQHHWVDAGRVAHPAFRIGMHVGTADAHRIDADLHFAGAGIGQRALHQAELPQAAQLGNAVVHRSSSL